ncbi:MAG: hypothetical protein K2I28_08705 [Muribaculaceae bacterium]|nr:hypothetical protein [Muribaculaceae bacterium]
MKTLTLLASSLLTLILSVSAMGADKVKVSGEAVYYAPESESPAEAKRKVIEMARINALEKAFGTVMSSQDMIMTSERESRAMSLGISDVNGEWLADRKDPVVTDERAGREYIYRAKVEGWARAIDADRIEIDSRLLINGCDKNRSMVRDNTFYSGDEMFLYFNSPVDGWLAVYLGDDDEALTMQCLLPYDGQNTGSYPVKANSEYVFFAKELAEPEVAELAAGLVMESRKAVDFNVLYVIFSPNEFSGTGSVENQSREHTTLTADGEVNLMPRETEFKRFQKWLGKKRIADRKMQVIKTVISIKKTDRQA